MRYWIIPICVMGLAGIFLWWGRSEAAENSKVTESEEKPVSVSRVEDKKEPRKAVLPPAVAENIRRQIEEKRNKTRAENYPSRMSPEQIEEVLTLQSEQVFNLLPLLQEKEKRDTNWEQRVKSDAEEFIKEKDFPGTSFAEVKCGSTICFLALQYDESEGVDYFIKNGGLAGNEWGDNLIMLKKDDQNGKNLLQMFFHNSQFSARSFEDEFLNEYGTPLMLGKPM